MKRMKVIGLFLAVLVLFGHPLLAPSAEPIKMVSLDVISGTMKNVGDAYQYGLKFAVEEVNAAGGLLGRPVKVFYDDHQLKPDVGTRKAMKYILEEKVEFLLSGTATNVGQALSELAEKEKIPMLNYGLAGDDMTGKLFNRHHFRVSLSVSQHATALAAYLATTPLKNCYILCQDYSAPRQGAAAFKKAMDRQAMLDTVLLGYGIIGDDNPVPPTSPYAWRSEVPGRDLEGAKKLLADAGYSSSKPLKVDFYTSEYIPGATALGQLFKEQMAEAGIEVNLIIGPASEHWDNVWLKFPFVGSGWNMRHPGEGLAIAYRSNAAYPETHWYRPEYDKLLDQANTEPDPVKRADLYKAAEKMLTEEGGALIPLFQKIVAAMSSKCDGYTPFIQLYRMDLRNVTCTK